MILFTACARITPISPGPPATKPRPAATAPSREPVLPPASQPAPVEEPQPAIEQAPAESVVTTPPPAVVALLEEAEASRSSGELDAAAAGLERGIRIQPRNPVLWHRLALVRLQQGQPQLAEELAKKSNVLSGADKGLIRENWLLIAEARRRQGDEQGAKDAEAKVTPR